MEFVIEAGRKYYKINQVNDGYSGGVHAFIDKKTGETLIGANIYNESSKQGAVSNSYGYFNLTIPKGDTRLICSYIGYSTDTLNINIQSKYYPHKY